MLAPIPCTPIEQHDTDIDAPKSERVRIRPKLAALRAEHGVAEVRPMPRKPVMHGSPVTPEQALQKGSVSKVFVREALVKVQHSFKEEAKDPIPQPAKFVMPEVRIAWLRSTDAGQKLIRYGADGFVVRGSAGGETCSPKKPMVSLGIDGLIFSVAVQDGDSADATLDRLVSRLESCFVVEVVERRGSTAVARIVSAR